MIRCWGQPKFATDDVKLFGYELFIREQHDHQWCVPTDFSAFRPDQIVDLLHETLKTLPHDLKIISFNLDQCQFVDPAYCTLLATICDQTQAKICVELTERLGNGATQVTVTQLKQAAQAYCKANIAVCIDDVSTGSNQLELVNQLNPYAVEYKFALQNVRGTQSCDQIQAAVAFWRTLAQEHHKLFGLEGFEHHEDVSLIRDFHPNIVQGYYFGRPHIMPIEADFRLDEP